MNIGSDVDFSFDQDIDRHAVPALKVHPKVLGHSADWAAPGRCRMRPDARRFENWEFNHTAVLGLGAAVDYALAWGLPTIEARVTALAVRRCGMSHSPSRARHRRRSRPPWRARRRSTGKANP